MVAGNYEVLNMCDQRTVFVDKMSHCWIPRGIRLFSPWQMASVGDTSLPPHRRTISIKIIPSYPTLIAARTPLSAVVFCRVRLRLPCHSSAHVSPSVRKSIGRFVGVTRTIFDRGSCISKQQQVSNTIVIIINLFVVPPCTCFVVESPVARDHPI